MNNYKTSILKTAGVLMLAGGGVGVTNTAWAGNGDFDASTSGYARTTAGISLEDHSESKANESVLL